MLGKTLRDLNAPRLLTTTTRITDAVFEHWREKRSVVLPTLADQENVWEEFWLSASSATDWCPRMSALQTALRASMGSADEEIVETLEPELLWLFGQGHAYHDLFQQKILPSLPNDVFRGSWTRNGEWFPGKTVSPPRCRTAGCHPGTQSTAVGHVVERGIAPRPEGDGWRYQEAKFRSHGYRIVVKLDGVLAWPDAPWEVLEIKTEKMEARDGLNPASGGMPRAKHIVQSNLGMWAAGLARARILYVFKGAPDLRTALIEHVIERDEGMIDKLKETATACVDAVRTMEMVIKECGDDGDIDSVIKDNLPPRLSECPMKSKGRARYCSARELCFPAGYRKAEKS